MRGNKNNTTQQAWASSRHEMRGKEKKKKVDLNGETFINCLGEWRKIKILRLF